MHQSCRQPSIAALSRTQISFSFAAPFRRVYRILDLSRLCGSSAAAAAVMMVGIAILTAPASAQTAPPAAVSTRKAEGDVLAVFIAEAAHRFGVPASWIRAVMQVESSGNVRGVSPKGAMGLMQIMPETWATLRARYDLGVDPFDAHDNILAGTAYLRELHDRYGGAGFLAAYNAGPARYEEYVVTGRPLPNETRAYVALLGPMLDGDQFDGAPVVAVAARSWTDAPLFTVRANVKASGARSASDLGAAIGSTDTAVQDLTALAPQSAILFVRPAKPDARR